MPHAAPAIRSARALCVVPSLPLDDALGRDGAQPGTRPRDLSRRSAIFLTVIGDRWGVTDDELARPFPCDEWVRSPTLEAWRAVTVHTTTDQLWPWVTQVRLAPYSYDWIDNLGRRSPQTLLDLDEPAAGQAFTRAAGLKLGRVLSVDPPRQITGQIAGAVISYVLDQQPDGCSTRLLMKLITDLPRPLAPLLSVGDLVMARRQLLNFKHLAETSSPAVG
jgi:hypothetical protein